MTYEEELSNLSSQVGRRNRRLLALAIKGRLAGRDAETMIAEIVAASGTPPLSTAEVRRAVEKAQKVPKINKFHRSPSPSPSPSTFTSPTYSFVREMIEKGGGKATSAELVALSKMPISQTPWEEAVAFIRMLSEPDSGFFFTGTPRMKRTRDRLFTLSELEASVTGNSENLPTHILPNDLTGEPVTNSKGEASYAREECVLHARHTVIEFDEMPLAEQAAFWKGIILADVLPLRALVYSGGKSIHALLRLDDRQSFKAQWQLLESYLAVDSSPRYRCDLAFRSPVQMMRFPGAIRPETNRRQELLYLD